MINFVGGHLDEWDVYSKIEESNGLFFMSSI